MPDISFRGLDGSKVDSTDLATSLGATAECHLFKFGFTPTPVNVAADYAAQECDFDNYAPITVAAWHAPVLNGTFGYMIFASAEVVFTWVSAGPDVGNQVGGYWIEDAAGKIRAVVIFQNPFTLNGPDQALVLTPAITSGTGG